MSGYEQDGQPMTRVSFGPKDWQTLPVEVVSMLITLWNERQPAQFGAYLAEIMTGARPTGSKRKAGEQ